ncbi:hypothetical protein D6T76_15970 [Enterobacter hormaechei]|nr:hypothetical protein D6T76_15970 [Enterobacter hormaechei]
MGFFYVNTFKLIHGVLILYSGVVRFSPHLPSPGGRGKWITLSPWERAGERHQTAPFYPVVYVPAAGKRHYVIHITLNCFFDVTKSAFLCYYERYRTFLSFNESA